MPPKAELRFICSVAYGAEYTAARSERNLSDHEANLHHRRRVRSRCSPLALACPRSRPPPAFEVDPLWPKPLPNHWLLGSVTGVAVDAQDHVWVVHRGYDSMTARTEIGAATNPKTAEACCVPAPPVLEFDAAGNLVGHWGGPGDKYDWPVSPGGIAVDAKGTSGSRRPDRPRFPAARQRSAARGRRRRRRSRAAATRPPPRRTPADGASGGAAHGARRSRRTRTC